MLEVSSPKRCQSFHKLSVIQTTFVNCLKNGVNKIHRIIIILLILMQMEFIKQTQCNIITISVIPNTLVIGKLSDIRVEINRLNNEQTFNLDIKKLSANAYVDFVLPGIYGNLTPENKTCVQVFNGSSQRVQFPCEVIPPRTIRMQKIYEIPQNQEKEKIWLQIPSIRNPLRSVSSGGFMLSIIDNGTLIDHTLEGNAQTTSPVIFLPDQFTQCKVTANGGRVQTFWDFSVEITITNGIPSDGYIKVSTPFIWEYGVTTQPNIPANVSCKQKVSNANLACSFSQDGQILYATLSNLARLNLSAGSVVQFIVSKIRTPTYVGSQQQITITSNWNDNVIIDTCSVTITDLSPLPFQSITFTNSTPRTVQSPLNSTLSITLSSPLVPIDQVILQFPSLSLTPPLLTSSSFLNSSNFTQFTVEMQGGKVRVFGFGDGDGKLASTTLVFFLNQLVNYVSVQPITIQVRTLRNGGVYQQGNVTYRAIEKIIDADIHVNDTRVKQTGQATIRVNSQLFFPTGSQIKITYPSYIDVSDVPQTLVVSASINNVTLTDVKFSVVNKVIRILNIFQTDFQGGQIQVRLPSWTNPPTTMSANYAIEIVSNTGYTIGKSTYTMQPTQLELNSVSVTPSSYQVLKKQVIYTIAFTNANPFTSISVLVPKQIKISSSYKSTCLPIIFTSCNLENLSDGRQNLTFIGTGLGGTYSLSWGANTNPNSFQPTESFTVTTFHNGFSVQQSKGIISLSMNTPSTLLQSKATPSQKTNSKQISIIFSLIFPQQISDGKLMIKIPQDIDINGSSCSLQNCRIVGSFVMLDFVGGGGGGDFWEVLLRLENVRNSFSFSPVPSFNVVVQVNNYLSIQDQIQGWTNTQPSQFTSIVSSNISFRGEITLFTINISSINSEQRYLRVSIDPSFEIINSTTLYGGSIISSIEIQFNINGLISSSVSFVLLTPSRKGNFTFTLRTFSPTNFLIGSSVTNSWSAQCQSTECRTCQQSQCLSCYSQNVSEYYLYDQNNKVCVRDCPIGSYLALQNCLPCSDQCLQCRGTATTCTQCQQGKFLDMVGNLCVENCPWGYFANQQSGICNKCISPCLSCLNLTKCLSCQSGKFFLNSTGNCQKNCPALVTIPNTILNICQPCSQQCLTCQLSPSSCLSCSGALLLFNKTCLSQCPIQNFPVDGQCQPCQSPCRLCTDSTNNCAACFGNSTNNVLFNQKCVQANLCPLGHFVTIGQGVGEMICLRCNQGCTACLAWDNCSSCQIGKYLNQGACVDQCPNGTYPNSSEYKCKNCQGCPTCTSDTICTSCPSGTYLHQSKCLSACPKKFYPNQPNSTNYFNCEACPSQCQSCTSKTLCTECQNSLLLFNGTCITSCPMGTFTHQLQCSPCPLFCQSCVSLNWCSSCTGGYSLEGNICVSRCAVGISHGGVCYPCGLHCSICQNAICKQCNPPYLLSSSSCVPTCPEGTLTLDNMTCVQCTEKFTRCKICSQNQCLSCREGRLIDGECQPCPLGMYGNDGTCVMCPSQCSGCISPINCFSCQNGLFLEGGSCLSRCPVNKVPNVTKCDICTPNCSICNQETYLCQVCVGGMFMYQGVCHQKCPQGLLPSVNYTLCMNSEQFSQDYSKASKAVYFPFLIVSVIIVAISLVIKVYTPQMHLVTFLVSVLGWIQLGCWICFGVIEHLFYSHHQLHALKGAICALVSVCFLVVANVTFLFIFFRYFNKDSQFIKWKRSHSFVNVIMIILASVFTFKSHRLVYSKFLNREEFSLPLSSVKKLVPISILSGISVVGSSCLMLIGTSLAIYYSLNKDQQYFNALDTLIVTSIGCIITILDFYHPYNYFIDEPESKNIKNKIFQKSDQIIDISQLNYKLKSGEQMQIQGGSNVSRQNLIQASHYQHMDQIATAKKMPKMSTLIAQEHHHASTIVKDDITIHKDSSLTVPENSSLSDITPQSKPPNFWVQKLLDQFGYIIKKDHNGNITRYDKNGYRVEIDKDGIHRKYDENGYLITIDSQTGVIHRMDPKTGYEVILQQNQPSLYKNKDGYFVRYNAQKKKWEMYDPTDGFELRWSQERGVMEKYDQEGFRVEIDQNGSVVRYDENNYIVVKDPVSGKIKRYNKQGFQVRISPQTGQHTLFNELGFRVVHSKNGNITLYDENGNLIIIDPQTKTIRKYNKEGLQIIQTQNGQPILKDKRGRIVVEDQGVPAGFRKFVGDKQVYVDKEGFEVQVVGGWVMRWDKRGQLVSKEEIAQGWKREQDRDFDIEQEYKEMVQGEKNKLRFLNQEKIQIEDEFKEFHEDKVLESGQIQKEYETLYFEEQEFDNIKKDEQDQQMKIDLNELKEINHLPNEDLKQIVISDPNEQNQNKKDDVDGEQQNNLVIEPENYQDKHEIKSVVDASIDQRSFQNEGVQPITDQSQRMVEDDLNSVQQIDAFDQNQKRRNITNYQTLKVFDNHDEFDDGKSQRSQISVSQTENRFNKVDRKSKIKNKNAKKLNQLDDQNLSSLGEEDWIKQNEKNTFFENNIFDAQYSREKTQDFDNMDTLSDYIASQTGVSDTVYKNSEQNSIYWNKMQSIEEVEDQLFERIKNEKNNVRRQQFKLTGEPNPLVEYAKTIEAKRAQSQFQMKGKSSKKQRKIRK